MGSATGKAWASSGVNSPWEKSRLRRLQYIRFIDSTAWGLGITSGSRVSGSCDQRMRMGGDVVGGDEQPVSARAQASARSKRERYVIRGRKPVGRQGKQPTID